MLQLFMAGLNCIMYCRECLHTVHVYRHQLDQVLSFCYNYIEQVPIDLGWTALTCRGCVKCVDVDHILITSASLNSHCTDHLCVLEGHRPQ